MKISTQMRATLEALAEISHGIDAGDTVGEIVAAGGSRSCLYSAVRKGWAAKYGWRQGFTSDSPTNTPRYWRTDEGTAALNEA